MSKKKVIPIFIWREDVHSGTKNPLFVMADQVTEEGQKYYYKAEIIVDLSEEEEPKIEVTPKIIKQAWAKANMENKESRKDNLIEELFKNYGGHSVL